MRTPKNIVMQICVINSLLEMVNVVRKLGGWAIIHERMSVSCVGSRSYCLYMLSVFN